VACRLAAAHEPEGQVRVVWCVVVQGAGYDEQVRWDPSSPSGLGGCPESPGSPGSPGSPVCPGHHMQPLPRPHFKVPPRPPPLPLTPLTPSVRPSATDPGSRLHPRPRPGPWQWQPSRSWVRPAMQPSPVPARTAAASSRSVSYASQDLSPQSASSFLSRVLSCRGQPLLLDSSSPSLPAAVVLPPLESFGTTLDAPSAALSSWFRHSRPSRLSADCFRAWPSSHVRRL